MAEHFDVEAGGFRLGENILDVGGQRLALFFETLDALDDAAQPLGRDAADIGAGKRFAWFDGHEEIP